MKILAIDLSSYGGTSVCCLYDTDTKEGVFKRVETSLEAIRNHVEATSPAEVCFEACGVSHIMHQNLLDGPWTVTVANVNEPQWCYRAVKKKTDREDALKIAKLASTGDITPVHIPSERVRQWRHLIHFRTHLVQRRTKIRNQIRSVLDREGIAWPKNWEGWTPKAREHLTTLASHDANLPLAASWRFHLSIELLQLDQIDAAISKVESRLRLFAKEDERVALIRTIPGVGARLAESLVSYIDDPSRFRTGKQVANSVGLTPRIFQSGESERLTRISKRGNGHLRTMLVEVAWIGRQFNPWLAATFDKVCNGSTTRRKTAAVACARRLLIRAWAMMRDNTPWDPGHQPA